jgi:MFS transporter, DHA1 family, inner membrane transport protein
MSNPGSIFRILLLIGSGVVAAAQIGKAIISIPLIRADMSIGLDVAGLIVATFASLGASIGVGLGAVVERLGVRRSLIGGMGLIATGNLIGAAAPDASILLAARLVEGIGFFGAVLAIPSTLARVVDENRRDFVMAAWSAYMPTGIMLMLLLAPLLESVGWRAIWQFNALLAAACTLLLALYAPELPRKTGVAAGHLLTQVARVLRHRQSITLAVAFFAYSCQIFSMAFALPLVLTSAHGVALGSAGLLSAAVLAVSAAGHVLSGFLLRAGVPIWANVAASFCVFALSASAVYGELVPATVVGLAAALALGVGGLAPGALYAAAPRVAVDSRAIPATIGMLQQASNLGQFIGPLVLAIWVQDSGWRSAPAIIVPMALLGLAAAFTIRRQSEPATSGTIVHKA